MTVQFGTLLVLQGVSLAILVRMLIVPPAFSLPANVGKALMVEVQPKTSKPAKAKPAKKSAKPSCKAKKG